VTGCRIIAPYSGISSMARQEEQQTGRLNNDVESDNIQLTSTGFALSIADQNNAG